MPKTRRPAPKLRKPRRPEWKVSELSGILLKVAVSIEALEERLERIEALLHDVFDAVKRPRRASAKRR